MPSSWSPAVQTLACELQTAMGALKRPVASAAEVRQLLLAILSSGPAPTATAGAFTFRDAFELRAMDGATVVQLRGCRGGAPVVAVDHAGKRLQLRYADVPVSASALAEFRQLLEALATHAAASGPSSLQLDGRAPIAFDASPAAKAIVGDLLNLCNECRQAASGRHTIVPI